MRCLAKDPSGRLQSASELKVALAAAAIKRAAQQPSIAVLPFVNMSRDADDEYFSDDLPGEILAVPAHIPG